MPKINRHGRVSNAKEAEPVPAPDTDESADAASKPRRRGRHEAPEAPA